jgi:hypothetical protein
VGLHSFINVHIFSFSQRRLRNEGTSGTRSQPNYNIGNSESTIFFSGNLACKINTRRLKRLQSIEKSLFFGFLQDRDRGSPIVHP